MKKFTIQTRMHIKFTKKKPSKRLTLKPSMKRATATTLKTTQQSQMTLVGLDLDLDLDLDPRKENCWELSARH